MRLLLEFKDYNELNFIKEVVDDIFLSEIDEQIDPKIHKSILTISDNQITCHDLVRSEYSSDLEFRSYLVSFKSRMEEDTFNEISKTLESILSSELDEKIKCISLQFFPINEFIICNEDDYYTLKSIYEFEYLVEEQIYEIKDNEFSSVLDFTIDDIEDNKGLTIWLREYSSKVGINLLLIRGNIKSNHLSYKIFPNFFLNTARDLIGRWLQDLNLNFPIPSSVDKWIEKNLNTKTSDLVEKLSIINDKINSLNLSFELDLNTDSENEAERFLKMLREKVFPIFSNVESNKIAELFNEFRKLEEYQIDADWYNRGNYFFLFNINFKDNFYIFDVYYDMKKDIVKIELKDKNIIEEVPINEFSQTIYLLLQEN